MYNPFSLEGKTILVTGASSGIGRGIAITCSKMGAQVIICGRNEERLCQTKELMEGSGHLQILADLTKANDIREMIDKMQKLDGIVHCAGIGQRIPCRELEEEDINTVMEINFKAPVMLQKYLLSEKKVNKGASIVFIASIASWSPSAGNSIYSASKGAIISYANCLSLELAPRQIRVNCISPAMVWTDFVKKDVVCIELLKEDEGKYPLQRYGTPDDIANLAIYMLSDASSWMTGSNVKISGGGK